MAEVTIVRNVFWIGANLLFDLQTGATNQVMMFVHREEDASVFTEANAQAYLAFVKSRAERFSPGINWFVEKSKLVGGRWVIKGEQDVS
jgi:hypothetical protein